MLFASGISLSQKTPLCESTLCVLGLGLVLGWVWSATVIPAEGQRRTQVSAMAVICVRGEDTSVRQIRKAISQQASAPHSRSSSRRERGRQGGWD